MGHEFNYADLHAKSRPPTIVRIEVELVSRKVIAVWESLQIAMQMAFALDRMSGNSDSDVFSSGQMAIGVLEKADPPFRFVDGDTVEIWALEDGDARLVAMAAVTVAPLFCSECAPDAGGPAN
jgi:hypothetical protein